MSAATAEPGQAAGRRPVTRRRRRPAHDVTFSTYVDAWLSARMDQRHQSRSGVIEDLILAEIDRGGRRLSAGELNDLAGHANAIGLLLAPLRLQLRNPDHLRALADVAAALAQIKRVLHGAS